MAVSVVRGSAEAPPRVGSYERYALRMMVDPSQFGAIRRIVGAHLRLWGRERLTDATTICVTEMLTNVHRHVRTPECELTLFNLPEGIRAAVTDLSPDLPVIVEHPDEDAESGRGMYLLAHTAELWGATRTGTGKTVWVLLGDES